MTHEDKRQPGVNDKFRNMTKTEKRKAEKDLRELQRKAERMIAKVKDTATSIRATADTLDKISISARILGGVLTFTGGIADAFILMRSSGVGSTVVSIGVTAVTFGTRLVKDVIISIQMERAEMKLKETIECINDVNNTVQSWDNGSVKGKLSYLRFHAMQTLDLTDPVVRILQNALSSKSGEIMETKDLQEDQQVALCSKTVTEVCKTVIRAAQALKLTRCFICSGFALLSDVEQLPLEAARMLRQTADELEKLC